MEGRWWRRGGSRVPLSVVALAALVACRDGATEPDPTRAQTVEVSPARVYLMEGLDWELSATARTGEGLPAAGSVEWTSSAPAVATVDDGGRVVAVTPGQATVTARVDGAKGTVEVVVVEEPGGLPFSADAPLEVVPEDVWDLRGEGLDGVTVTIGGILAQAQVEGDSAAVVSVPALDAFGPCLPPSVRVDVRAAGWVAAVAAPGRAPFGVDLAPGERAALDPAVEHGCAIDAPAGEYLLAAAVVDDPAAQRAGVLVPDSVTLEVWSGDPAAPRVPAPGAARARLSGPGAPDLIPRPAGVRPGGPARAGAVASCSTPTAVGDSVLLPTGRDEDGRYDWGAPTTDEWWYLVAQTPHLNLVVDSAGARVWAADPWVHEELSTIMEMYEDEWMPVWNELYQHSLPDRDGNGRMIMRSAWNSAVGGGGGSGVYAQSDCAGGWRQGEEFYVPMDAYSDDPERAPAYLRAYHRAVVQHEAGHTHDLARRYVQWGGSTYTSQVAAEGIASFFTTYWLLKKRGAAPLLGNHGPESLRVDVGGLTYEPGGWQIVPDISHTYEWSAWAAADGYTQSLQFITWVAAQAVRSGRPVSGVLSGLVHASDARTTYGSIFRDGTGEAADDAEVLARWAFSWLADEGVSAAPPELTIPTWNTRAVYDAADRTRPGPAADLEGPARAVLELGEPDVRLVELVTDGSAPFGVRVEDRGAAEGLHVQVLRTR